MMSLFPQQHYQCQSGELWRLGQHLLLVGDATKEEDIERLISAHRTPASAVITDPPYGEIQARWDKMTLSFIPHLSSVASYNATCAIFCSLPFGFTLQQAMGEHAWEFRWDLVWTKKNAGALVSKQMPLTAHEHIFGYIPEDTPATTLTFNGYEAGEQGERWGDKHRAFKRYDEVYAMGDRGGRQGRSDGQRWLRSLLDGRKKQELPLPWRSAHPSQKPPELVEKLVLLLTHEGETVYDCFLGSGTTLLACERTGRHCIGIEQSSLYCTEILERWQRYTNQEPVLLLS